MRPARISGRGPKPKPETEPRSIDNIGKGGSCDEADSGIGLESDATSRFVTATTLPTDPSELLDVVALELALECLRGLKIRTMIRPKMISRRRKMHFRRPVLRWYLFDSNRIERVQIKERRGQ